MPLMICKFEAFLEPSFFVVLGATGAGADARERSA